MWFFMVAKWKAGKILLEQQVVTQIWSGLDIQDVDKMLALKRKRKKKFCSMCSDIFIVTINGTLTVYYTTNG